MSEVDVASQVASRWAVVRASRIARRIVVPEFFAIRSGGRRSDLISNGKARPESFRESTQPNSPPNRRKLFPEVLLNLQWLRMVIGSGKQEDAPALRGGASFLHEQIAPRVFGEI